MTASSNGTISLKSYRVWDRTTRWFHWLNFLSILALSIFGLGILYHTPLGIGDEGEILLKTLHVYVGYVFAVNLGWRMVWAFTGSPHSRWKAFLPFRRGFVAALAGSLRVQTRDSRPFLGHDPAARLMVTALFAMLLTQAISGLVLAGTDLYKPPLGGVMAEWVTRGDPQKMASLQPGSKAFTDPVAYDEMRAFRKPFRNTHRYLFYVLMGAIAVHIASVVVADIKKRNGLISAMFSGHKVFSQPPRDD